MTAGSEFMMALDVLTVWPWISISTLSQTTVSLILELLVVGLLATRLCKLYIAVLAFEASSRVFRSQHLIHKGLLSLLVGDP